VFALKHKLPDLEAREFFLLAKASWLITAAAVLLAFIAGASSNFKYEVALIPSNCVAAIFGLAVFFVYIFRRDFFILSIANAVAVISAFLSAAAMVSYVAAHYSYRLSVGLKDALLDSVDHLFYFDWLSLLTFLDKHQSLAQLLLYAYASIFPQAILSIIVLSAWGEYRRLQVLILSFQFGVMGCALASIALPALGEYTYLSIDLSSDFKWVPSEAISYVADVLQLRTNTPIMPLSEFKGIITFPSFHATLALLFMWALWKINRFFRWLSWILNGAMIFAIPIFGGHYFADIVAGLAVGGAAIWGAKTMANGLTRRLLLSEMCPPEAIQVT
jgi:hypothetical protein